MFGGFSLALIIGVAHTIADAVGVTQITPVKRLYGIAAQVFLIAGFEKRMQLFCGGRFGCGGNWLNQH